MTFHRSYLQNFSSFGKAVSGKKIFRNRAIWKKNCLWQPCLQTNRDEMSNLYRGPSIRCFLPSFSSFGKVISEKKIFRNPPIRNKNCLWRPCLLTNRDEMSNLYRRPSIHVFYQISVHLGKRFQRRRFFLEINQSEKRMACGSHVC